MFVVRWEMPDENPDFKVFTTRPSAMRRYHRGLKRMLTDDIVSVAIFEVAADNARSAVELVKSGKASLIELFPGT